MDGEVVLKHEAEFRIEKSTSLDPERNGLKDVFFIGYFSFKILVQ